MRSFMIILSLAALLFAVPLAAETVHVPGDQPTIQAGIDEILTGPGPSSFFGAHVRGWQLDGGDMVSMPGISFFAWDPGQLRYGAGVSRRSDLDGDGHQRDRGGGRTAPESCSRGLPHGQADALH